MSQTYSIKTGSFSGAITLNETIVGSTGNDDLKATGQITKNVSVSQLNGQNIFQIFLINLTPLIKIIH